MAREIKNYNSKSREHIEIDLKSELSSVIYFIYKKCSNQFNSSKKNTKSLSHKFKQSPNKITTDNSKKKKPGLPKPPLEKQAIKSSLILPKPSSLPNNRYLYYTPKKLINLFKAKSPKEQTQQIEINLSDDLNLLSTETLSHHYINNENNIMISLNEEVES